MQKWLILALSGSLGTIARYVLAGFVYRVAGTDFPYGTLVVNFAGCFFIGFMTSLSEHKFLLGPNARLFLLIGFCGAFTTFSTFIFETANLMKDGQTLRAFWNVMLSVIVGFFIFRLGVLCGEVV
jgi:CrcB protein